MENAIIKVAENVKAIEALEKADLANAETVVGIVRTAHAIQQEAKAIKKADEAMKGKVKELVDNGKYQKVTMYDVANEQKVLVTYTGVNEAKVEPKGFLAALTNQLGPEKANEIFIGLCKSFTLDDDKLAALFKADKGVEKAAAVVTKPAPIKVSLRPMAMTAAEKKAAKIGGIEDGIVFG